MVKIENISVGTVGELNTESVTEPAEVAEPQKHLPRWLRLSSAILKAHLSALLRVLNMIVHSAGFFLICDIQVRLKKDLPSLGQ